MKYLSEYIIPLKDRKEFADYKKTHPDITPDEYVNRGLCKAMAEYDYNRIVFDFWETGIYTGKLDTVGAIMQWSSGHLIPSLVLQSFYEVTSNIEKYKKEYGNDRP